MKLPREPFAVRGALALHALFVRCCPRPFRRRFGVEMEQTFRAACRAAHSRGGSFAVTRTAAAACIGALGTAWRLHMDAVPPAFGRTVAVLLIALGLATLAGYVDQHEEDVQLPALLVFGGAFVCSCLRPRLAWMWWLIAGGSIPVAFVIASWSGHHAPFESEPYSWLIAFVPALVGAVAGVAVRRVLHPPQPPATA